MQHRVAQLNCTSTNFMNNKTVVCPFVVLFFSFCWWRNVNCSYNKTFSVQYLQIKNQNSGKHCATLTVFEPTASLSRPPLVPPESCAALAECRVTRDAPMEPGLFKEVTARGTTFLWRVSLNSATTWHLPGSDFVVEFHCLSWVSLASILDLLSLLQL